MTMKVQVNEVTHGCFRARASVLSCRRALRARDFVLSCIREIVLRFSTIFYVGRYSHSMVLGGFELTS